MTQHESDLFQDPFGAATVPRKRPVEIIRMEETKAPFRINISLPRETVALRQRGKRPTSDEKECLRLADECVMRIHTWACGPLTTEIRSQDVNVIGQSTQKENTKQKTVTTHKRLSPRSESSGFPVGFSGSCSVGIAA